MLAKVLIGIPDRSRIMIKLKKHRNILSTVMKLIPINKAVFAKAGFARITSFRFYTWVRYYLKIQVPFFFFFYLKLFLF